MLGILALLFLLLPDGVPSSSPPVIWTHHLSLHEDLSLSWSPLDKDIHFELVGRTIGWMALGFSENGAMRGSDIVLGWVNENGTPHFSDRYAIGNQAPLVDKSQDVELINASQNETHTVLRFSRAWDTCDSSEDLKLGEDTVRLIWAFGLEDPPHGSDPGYHGASLRGVRSVYLKELPFSKMNTSEESGILSWDLAGRNILLPNDHTHYWCQIFKAPQMDRKHHMIGFEPIIRKGNEEYLHHMVLYECHVRDGSTEEWFEAHVGQEGAACYSPNMPPEWSFCLATNSWAWAVGSEGETLPEHVGMPLGEEFGGATYFMLEIHYDNPSRDPIEDSSGLRIFYTDRLREYDTAMLLIGTEVNFLHLVPPRQEGFTSLGRCVAGCTREGLPSEGIRLINGVLHSHLASRKMKIRHLRKGRELPVILKDDHYDFNYQVARIPPKETKVLPGDELLLECQYETKNRSKPTFGGLSTREEMCMAFILYYPRAPLADCRSLPTLETIMRALHVESIYGTAFEKLVAFMKDIGSNGHMGDDHLKELIEALYVETGVYQKKPARKEPQEVLILSEEDLLNKPFYTVETPPPVDEPPKDYRTLLPEMLLNLRIKDPLRYRNVTLGEHFFSMNWTDPKIWKTFMRALYFGDHSSLCLGHGRKPIIPYERTPFPRIGKGTEFKNMESSDSSSCPSSSNEPFTQIELLEDLYEYLKARSRSSSLRLSSTTLLLALLYYCR